MKEGKVHFVVYDTEAQQQQCGQNRPSRSASSFIDSGKTKHTTKQIGSTAVSPSPKHHYFLLEGPTVIFTQ